MYGPALALVVGACHLQRAVVTARHIDRRHHRVRQSAFRALDGDGPTVDRDINPGGYDHREFADSRHRRVSFPSPNVGEDFSAYPLLHSLTVGEQTLTGGDDGDAKTAKHL